MKNRTTTERLERMWEPRVKHPSKLSVAEHYVRMLVGLQKRQSQYDGQLNALGVRLATVGRQAMIREAQEG